MADRCIWTFQRDDRVVPVTVDAPALFGGRTRLMTVHVLPEHEDELRAYLDLAVRYARTALYAMLALAAAIVVVTIGALALQVPDRLVAIAVGGLTAAIGLVLVALPFSTPQTVMVVGLRQSVRIARWIGWVTVAIGAAIAALG